MVTEFRFGDAIPQVPRFSYKNLLFFWLTDVKKFKFTYHRDTPCSSVPLIMLEVIVYSKLFYNFIMLL